MNFIGVFFEVITEDIKPSKAKEGYVCAPSVHEIVKPVNTQESLFLSVELRVVASRQLQPHSYILERCGGTAHSLCRNSLRCHLFQPLPLARQREHISQSFTSSLNLEFLDTSEKFKQVHQYTFSSLV